MYNASQIRLKGHINPGCVLAHGMLLIWVLQKYIREIKRQRDRLIIGNGLIKLGRLRCHIVFRVQAKGKLVRVQRLRRGSLRAKEGQSPNTGISTIFHPFGLFMLSPMWGDVYLCGGCPLFIQFTKANVNLYQKHLTHISKTMDLSCSSQVFIQN